MRLYRYKIKPATKQAITSIQHLHNILDTDLAHDVYCLVHLKGRLPSERDLKRIRSQLVIKEQIADAYARVFIAARMNVLTMLKKSYVFKALMLSTRLSATGALDRLFAVLFRASYVRQVAQCVTCQLLRLCKFGQTYKDKIRRIELVRDPNYAALIHPECPERPKLEAASMLMSGCDSMDVLKDSPASVTPGGISARGLDLGGGGTAAGEYAGNSIESAELVREELRMRRFAEVSPSTGFSEGDFGTYIDDEEALNYLSASHSVTDTGAGKGEPGAMAGFRHDSAEFAVANPDFVNRLTSANFIIYQLGRILDGQINRANKIQLSKDTDVGGSPTDRTYRNLRDMPKLEANQHALPDEVFQRKQAGRNLIVRDQKATAPQSLYILEDTSGSMITACGKVQCIPVTRAGLARAFTLAIGRRLKTEQGALLYRAFEGTASAQFSAKLPAEFEALDEFLVNNASPGGGTSVANALNIALDDLETCVSKGWCRSRELVLFSDGDDFIMDKPETIAHFTERLKQVNVELSAVLFGRKTGAGLTGIVQLSKRHYFVGENGNTVISVEDLVNVLK